MYTDITVDSLIVDARSKFNNMDDKDLEFKVDPRDAKILPLTMVVENIKKDNSGGKSLTSSAINKSAHLTNREAWEAKVTDGEFIDGLTRWRIKKEGPRKTVNGREYFWCPHHVKEGKWNGMYVTHRPDQHKGRKPKACDTAAAKPEEKKSSDANLTLQTKLKEVMCTNLCLSSDDIDTLFANARAEN